MINFKTEERFIVSCEEFCKFIEVDSSSNPEEFLRDAQKLFLNLYLSGLSLSRDNKYRNKHYEDQVNLHNFEETKHSIAKRLLNYRYYWIVLEPNNDIEVETGCGDLLDDLSDIYTDIKTGLLVWNLELDGAKESALDLFKFGYDYHWGEHCVNAIYAAHYFLRK